MTISAGKYTIELDKIKEQGNNWIVRLSKKILFFNKTISTDWFLEEAQARTFASQLAERLNGGASADIVRNRKPGWTLVRPAR